MKHSTLQPRLRWIWRGFALASLASLVWLGLELGGAPDKQTTDAQAEIPSRRVAAYVMDRASVSFSDADAANLDQLNFSFALIKNGQASGSHWSSIGKFKAYIQKHPHILPVLSVGGWGADGFSQAAATADGRERFAASAVKLMQEHGFLGLDIDWEYPGSTAAGIKASADDTRNFTLLLQALRQALDGLEQEDGVHRLLAIAISGSPSQIRTLECQQIAKLVDQVNVMTYDLQTANIASHHTPLYATGADYPLSVQGAVSACIDAGLPAGKLMVGAAFYGRVFTMPSSDIKPFTAAKDSGSKTLRYSQIKADSGWTRYFDDNAKAPYAIKGKQFVTYDDPASIRAKGAYAMQNGLMGMMCWEYGGDNSGELLTAMRESTK